MSANLEVTKLLSFRCAIHCSYLLVLKFLEQEIEEKTYHGEVVKELPKKDGDGSAEGCGL